MEPDPVQDVTAQQSVETYEQPTHEQSLVSARKVPITNGVSVFSSDEDEKAEERVMSEWMTRDAPANNVLLWLSEEEARARLSSRFWGDQAMNEEALARPLEEGECSDACACCGLAECSKEDDIVYCEGCDGAFHQSCYYIPIIPEDDFYCRACDPTKCPPPEVVTPGEGDEELAWLLDSSGLGSSIDFFVVAALTDRFAKPAVALKELARSCTAGLTFTTGEPTAYEVLCKVSAGHAQRWCLKLSRQLRELGYDEEADWLPDDEIDALAKMDELEPLQRVRLLRCALECAIELEPDLRSRIRNAYDRFDRLGVDADGRSYFVFQDDAGDFALCRDSFSQRPPFLSAKSRQKLDKPVQKKRKRKSSSSLRAAFYRPETPSWQTIACSSQQLKAIVSELSASRHGKDLWLSYVLRVKLAPSLARAAQEAKLEAKRRERAKRRTKVAQNHLRLGSNDLLIFTDQPRKRTPVDYSFADYDRRIEAATAVGGTTRRTSRR